MTSDSPVPDDAARPGDGSFSQNVQLSQNTARVPEKIGRGVTSTGSVVLQGPHEFILDFLQRLAPPQQLVARVVLPVTLMPQFISALEQNLGNYRQRFGEPPALPPLPPGIPIPKIEEVYDSLKLPEEALAGAYANAVMISHSPAEFCLDFICNAFPRSQVTCRVFLASFHIVRLLESLTRSYGQWQKRREEGGGM